MSGHYDYYQEICACPAPVNGAGDVYGYMNGICVCPGTTVVLGMRDLNGDETTRYPVSVYNVNLEFIGTANTKGQYITIWNSDPSNQAVGTLSTAPGPFNFYLDVNAGQNIPPYVIGDPEPVVDTGIYATQYTSQYE